MDALKKFEVIFISVLLTKKFLYYIQLSRVLFLKSGRTGHPQIC